MFKYVKKKLNQKLEKYNQQIEFLQLQLYQLKRDQFQRQQYPFGKNIHNFINKLFFYLAKIFNTYSLKGVLKTLSVPYFLFKSRVHLKTPPNLTSSPKIIALL